jgi:hypothetical protein
VAELYQVAAYYFPQYHPDPRNDRRHGKNWTEWELVRRAEPRFPGHQQPKLPAWGFQDESDPDVMARKIAAAADNGLDAFIFDWYWYDDGPFLNGALDRGFLGAANNDRLRFALMWANHDWINLFPAKRGVPGHLFAPGAVARASFDAAADYIIERYLRHPSYWRLDGRAYLSIYELARMVGGLGGVGEARAAMESLRAKARAAGVGELHLNAVMWGVQILPSELTVRDPNALLDALGFDSVTSYIWIHHLPMDKQLTVSYAETADKAAKQWVEFSQQYSLPYFPNVTMGWDPSPRTAQSDEYGPFGYPYTSILTGNTSLEFRKALEQARAFLDTQPANRRVLTINAWNEWTEGSYLEPDTLYGMAYLEAIRDVFGRISLTPPTAQGR